MQPAFLRPASAKKLLAINSVMAVVYLVALLTIMQRGNIYLFIALMVGEVYHLWQVLTFVQAAWQTAVEHPFSATLSAPVDVYITVAGEPAEVVAQTVAAAVQLDYPHYRVYLLNDGYVANKSNWPEIEQLAHQYRGVECITRRTAGGAKAGNINHALGITTAPFVAVLDCDHIPEPDWLKRSMGYFIDEAVAFVQSPQFYRNQEVSYVAGAAWEQQTLFFGPICRGKDRTGAMFMCGTNMVIRRAALDSVGGMKADSITEDLLTSIVMQAKGWRSVYEPTVLAQGLAPEDLRSYWKQQFRWARGSLEVLLRYNPLFLRGLAWRQRLQYLSSVTFYLSGLVVLADALLPLFYFFGGHVPITSASMAIALIFIPYIFLTLYAMQEVSHYAFTFRAIAFAIAAWPIHLSALLATLLRRRSGFSITPKTADTGNYWYLVIPHFLYIGAVVAGIGWAAWRDGFSPSLITNASWSLIYVALFLPFIRAALPERWFVDEPTAVRPEVKS